MSKKIIGYGICGPGEAGRYMRDTMECFKRLCDEVVILCNNCDQAELNLIDEYGFKRVNDRREWGTHQWRIKQDFIERDIKQMANEGDMLVCLDMDEVLSERCTKEWLLEAPLEAYHVFIVDLWNDPQHFKLESCFWNVRIWKWNGETKYKAKPVHCGLAPEWTYHYHRHAPFLLFHKGLMAREDRQRKIKRYEKYDPHAEHLAREYYDMLRSDTARPFDEAALSKQIEEEVATYNQSKPKQAMVQKPKERYAYVKNPHGVIVDIPEKHLAMTMKQKGFEFVNWADEVQDEIEAMFEDDEEGEVAGATAGAQADTEDTVQDTVQVGEQVETTTPDHIGDTDEMVVDKPVDSSGEVNGDPITVTSENAPELVADAVEKTNEKKPDGLHGFAAPKKTAAKKVAPKKAK